MSEKKVYPTWVQQYRTTGTTVKKVGNNYYLYRHSSKRVPGKKNPVPMDTYIGKITPEGVEKRGARKISSGEIEVKEFGFSTAVEQLCPQGWKEPLGKDWQKTLDYIIVREMPESYITKARKVPAKLNANIQYGAQLGALNRRIKAEHEVEIKELKCLANIYLVYIGRQILVSKITDEQRVFAERYGIRLEVD